MRMRSIGRALSTICAGIGAWIAVGCGPAPAPERVFPSERDVLATWNAMARRGATTDTLFGTQVADPFRQLEVDDAATHQWIEAQTRRTEQMLSAVELPGAEARLRALLSIGTLERPVWCGRALCFLRRDGERERSALFLRDGAGHERLLLAPEAHGERAAIDWFYPSPDGMHVAVGISRDGDERSTLSILRTRDGSALDETIARTKWSSVSWLHDGSGFYYTRYPAPGEAGYDESQPESYYPRIFFHALGAASADDPLIWGGPAPTDFPFVSVSDDDRYLVFHNFRGWTAADIYVVDRGERRDARVLGPDATHPLRTVIAGLDVMSNGVVRAGALYLQTRLDAPNGRIVRIALGELDDRSAWRDVVPESTAAIEDWAMTADAIAVHRITNVRSTLTMTRIDAPGTRVEVTLPEIGAIDGLDGAATHDQLAFAFSAFFTPPSAYTVSAMRPTPVAQVRIASSFDATRFVSEQHSVRSADGTAINAFVLRARDMPHDGNQPTWLYGYGGFSVSLLPSFSRNALYWLERGGVYVVSNLRGGGELGESWHRAGMGPHKHHVFEDFEAVIQWLHDSRISRPGRIAIQGGSNGGLLMGAMLTRVPETVGAVIASVGLYDMVRYTQFPPAALWISEYGDPARAEDFAVLYGYSPYHHVRDGVRYPFTLIETADHDTRVHWAHSTKLTARLQEAAMEPERIYFHMEKQVGHGRGTGLDDQVARALRMQRFVTRALGM